MCGTLLAKTVEKEEEKVMRILRAAVEERGWKVGSLIHDAVIVDKKHEAREREELCAVAQLVLDDISEDKGWGRGILRAKITNT